MSGFPLIGWNSGKENCWRSGLVAFCRHVWILSQTWKPSWTHVMVLTYRQGLRVEWRCAKICLILLKVVQEKLFWLEAVKTLYAGSCLFNMHWGMLFSVMEKPEGWEQRFKVWKHQQTVSEEISQRIIKHIWLGHINNSACYSFYYYYLSRH